MAFPAALPMILWGATLGNLIKRVLLWVLVAKGAAIVTRLFVTLGLAFLTYEYVIDPVVSQVTASVNGLPPDLVVWLRAFGVLEVISILISAELIAMGKRVFLGKRE